ncbi:MAG: DUF11 domain-containing protein [Acidobacteria bacterium]|nr:DUF11 domain-containing protein [Acidobacteriota bacterium]
MRHTATSRRLLSISLAALVLLPNLLNTPARAASPAHPGFTYNPPLPANGKIAYNKWGADNSSPEDGVYLINADGTGDTKIPGSEQDHMPVWSPDGTRIAVTRVASQSNSNVSGFGVEIINPDGTGRVRLNDNVEPTERVAWSPDGQKIAYTSWGEYGADADIMVMNLDGSNVVNLTNTPGYDYLPTWSPDGQKIAFASKRDGDANTEIYVMNADGSGQHNITNYYNHDYYPAWSPDGQKIAFVSINRGAYSDRTGIFVMNADGSNVTFVNAGAPVGGVMPAWSPDGSKIIYNSDRDGNCDLYTINPDGTGEQRLTTEPTRDSGASWQPLGAPTPAPTPTPTPTPPAPTPTPSSDMEVFVETDVRTVVSGGQAIYTIYVSNYGPEPTTGATLNLQLPAGVALYDVENTSSGGCSGSTDATGVTPLTCAFPNLASGQTHIVTLTTHATGEPHTRYRTTFAVSSPTFDPYAPNNSVYHDLFIAGAPVPTPTPAVSGNNPLIAYTTYRDGNSEIYARRADGTAQSNLSNNPTEDSDFAWSPDGSHLAFTRTDPMNFTTELYVSDADGSNQTRLTQTADGYEAEPAWSPDGTRIVFARQSTLDYTTSLFVIDADGSNLLRLTEGVADYDPAWSPDGQKIAFSHTPITGGAASTSLYLINPDGTNLRALSASTSADYEPVWSPDGSKVAFISYRNGNREIFVMNADGTGQTPLINDSPGSDYAPRWSPNGQKIAFYRINSDSYGAGIYIVNADGTGLIHFGGDAEFNTEPDWSPDGTRLAFRSQRNGGSLDLINADGTGRVDLTNEPNYYTSPRWQPVVEQPNTPAGSDVTVASDGVALTFSNVTGAGVTTITPIDPNSLQGVPGEYVINADSLAFEIHTAAAYTGTITLGFQVPDISNPSTFSTLRVLHGEPPAPNFVDRTILAPDSPSHDFAARTVYARVGSLSPFLVAEFVSPQDAPPDINITSPAGNGSYLLGQPVIVS